MVALMKKGPSTRGKSRNHFLTKDGKEHDLYELIVKSIAENPPLMRQDFDTIRERINQMIDEKAEKPSPNSIKDSLAKLHDLLNEREDIFKVMDWKDGVLYIVDPLFLFYLRWGG